MKKHLPYLLTILRMLIGWHFLYEGITKLLNPAWSAKFYLLGSKWIFAGLFHWLASSPSVLKVVDFLNIWGLILIGLSLIIGLFVRWSSIFGAVLLLFYFVAYPPIFGYTLGVVAEGNYQWVDKNLIELFILVVFVFLPTEYFFGADRLLKRWNEERPNAPVPASGPEEGVPNRRRELLRDMIGVPFLGAFAYVLYRKNKWDSLETKFLTGQTDAVSGATLKSFQFTSLEELKGTVPKGKIGDFELSRLVMGGNLIGGWAHARDLIYVDKLIRMYHTDEKVMLTLQLAEKCGINGIISNPAQCRIINKYRQETGGKMQFISDCGAGNNFREGIEISIEGGAQALYSHGGKSDTSVYNNDLSFFDELFEGLELIRSYGKPAGIGAHRIETVKECVKRGIKPDFWVKTLHSNDYWSAEVDLEKKDVSEVGWKDNNFCLKPQEAVDFMSELEEPWIAFKTLAAGAITPEKGFRYAFDSGADFICVGMYDFQIVEDVNIVLDVLANVNRSRPWRG
ncbi:MAG: DoxX family membrane protein [Bacteroidota bacterium]